MFTELRGPLPPVDPLISAELPAYQPVYHDLVPWQEFEQLRDVAFQPMVVTRLVTPFMCVVAVTAVLL